MLALLSAVLCAASGTASASDSYLGAVAEKTAHGIHDVLLAPFEVLIQPIAWGFEYERERRPGTGGFIAGLIASPAAIGGRAWEGVFSLVTFPIAVPGPPRQFRLCYMGCRPFTELDHFTPKNPDPYWKMHW
jgi:hypothetical protein